MAPPRAAEAAIALSCPTCPAANTQVRLEGASPNAFDVKVHLECNKGHKFSLLLASTMRGEVVWSVGLKPT